MGIKVCIDVSPTILFTFSGVVIGYYSSYKEKSESLYSCVSFVAI